MPKDSISSTIAVNLSAIEAIANDLPRVGKRSELSVRSEEIIKLVEIVRRQVYMLEVEKINEKYTPDFRQYGGGAAGKKSTEGGDSSGG